MALLEDIQDYVNRIMPHHSAAHIIPRGIAIPIDTFLVGPVRFARKIGNFLPVLVPDNTVVLIQAAAKNDQHLHVSSLLSSFIPGAIVSLARGQLAEIDDAITFEDDEGIIDYRIGLTEAISGPVAYDEEIILHAVPISVNIPNPYIADITVIGSNGIHTAMEVTANVAGPTGRGISIVFTVAGALAVVEDVAHKAIAIDYVDGITTANAIIAACAGLTLATFTLSTGSLGTGTYVGADNMLSFATTMSPGVRVLSEYPIYPGDSVSMFTNPDLIMSLTDTAVVDSTEIGTIVGGTLYDLVLSDDLPLTVNIGDVIYLRGFPAYQSTALPIPTNPVFEGQIGPLILDYISGTIADVKFEDGEQAFDETLTLEWLASDQSEIQRTVGALKNTIMPYRGIEADMILFWDLIEGKLNYRESSDETICIANADGQFAINTPLVPSLGTDVAWIGTLINPEAVVATVTFTFFPNAPQTFTIPAGGFLPATFGVSAVEDNPTRLEIAVTTAVDGELYIRDMAVVGQQVDYIRYSLVTNADGVYDWISSGLIVKPLWISLDMLKARHDYANFNGGKIFQHG